MPSKIINIKEIEEYSNCAWLWSLHYDTSWTYKVFNKIIRFKLIIAIKGNNIDSDNKLTYQFNEKELAGTFIA